MFLCAEFQCADCDKVFDSLKVMKKRHYSIHKVHKDLLLKFQECDKKFQNKQKLADHSKHHKKKFCEICNLYVSQNNLSRHAEEKHGILEKSINVKIV